MKRTGAAGAPGALPPVSLLGRLGGGTSAKKIQPAAAEPKEEQNNANATSRSGDERGRESALVRRAKEAEKIAQDNEQLAKEQLPAELQDDTAGRGRSASLLLDFDEFRGGDAIVVTKSGNQKGMEGVVVDPDWSGRVKVRIADELKSYEAFELRKLGYSSSIGTSEVPTPQNQAHGRKISFVQPQDLASELANFSAVNHLGAQQKTQLATKLNEKRPEVGQMNLFKQKTHEAIQDPAVAGTAGTLEQDAKYDVLSADDKTQLVEIHRERSRTGKKLKALRASAESGNGEKKRKPSFFKAKESGDGDRRRPSFFKSKSDPGDPQSGAATPRKSAVSRTSWRLRKSSSRRLKQSETPGLNAGDAASFLANLDAEIQKQHEQREQAKEELRRSSQKQAGTVRVEDELLGPMYDKTRNAKKSSLSTVGKTSTQREMQDHKVNIYVIKAALKFRKILHEIRARKKRKRPWYVVAQGSRAQTICSSVLFLHLLVIAVYVPYEMSFVRLYKPRGTELKPWSSWLPVPSAGRVVMWVLIRLGLWVDVVLGFLTEVPSEEFDEAHESDWNLVNIAASYAFQGWLAVDLLAAVPLPGWHLGNALLKFTKFMYLFSRFGSLASVDINSKTLRQLVAKLLTVARLFSLFLSLCIVAHWVACGWYAVQWKYGDPCDPATYEEDFELTGPGGGGGGDGAGAGGGAGAASAASAASAAASSAANFVGLGDGMTGTDWGRSLWEENWTVMQKLCTQVSFDSDGNGWADIVSQQGEGVYYAHVFWAVSVVFRPQQADTQVFSSHERLYSMAIVALGWVVYTVTLGVAVSLFHAIYRKDKQVFEARSQIDRFCVDHHLPNSLKRSMIEAAKFKERYQGEYKTNQILESLPVSVREQVILFINREMVMNIRYLNGKSNQFVCAIIQKLQPQITCPGDFIVRQGDQSEAMFFIKKGTCVVLHDDAVGGDGEGEGEGAGKRRGSFHSHNVGSLSTRDDELEDDDDDYGRGGRGGRGGVVRGGGSGSSSPIMMDISNAGNKTASTILRGRTRQQSSPNKPQQQVAGGSPNANGGVNGFGGRRGSIGSRGADVGARASPGKPNERNKTLNRRNSFQTAAEGAMSTLGAAARKTSAVVRNVASKGSAGGRKLSGAKGDNKGSEEGSNQARSRARRRASQGDSPSPKMNFFTSTKTPPTKISPQTQKRRVTYHFNLSESDDTTSDDIPSHISSQQSNTVWQKAVLRAGDFFGEIGCILNMMRNDTVMAESMVEYYLLSKKDLLELMAEFPAFEEDIRQKALQRISSNTDKNGFLVGARKMSTDDLFRVMNKNFEQSRIMNSQVVRAMRMQQQQLMQRMDTLVSQVATVSTELSALRSSQRERSNPDGGDNQTHLSSNSNSPNSSPGSIRARRVSFGGQDPEEAEQLARKMSRRFSGEDDDDEGEADTKATKETTAARAAKAAKAVSEAALGGSCGACTQSVTCAGGGEQSRRLRHSSGPGFGGEA